MKTEGGRMRVKGKREYEKFLKGEELSRKEAMLAHCFVCNGEEDGGEDCLGKSNCPMYQYFPYK